MSKGKFKQYLLMITYAIILAFLFINIGPIFNLFKEIIDVLSPLWIGLILAIVINVPMDAIETKFLGEKNKRIRVVSMVLSILMIILLFLSLFIWIIPDFIDSITYLISSLPKMIENLNLFFMDTFPNTDFSTYLNDFAGASNLTNLLSSVIGSLLNNLSNLLSNFASLLINVFTGIIIAIYFLYDKEKIIETLKTTSEQIFDNKIVNKMKYVCKLTVKTIHDFIKYQCLECLILGTLMFISFKIFQFPYALTIAFLTAITAIIPVFGATFTWIIGIILIATRDVQSAMLFAIDYQIVQQIENNLIYPKVVGKNVGIPPVLTIISLIIFGKIGGLLGMLLCVPITSVIYVLIKDGLKKLSTKRQNMITKTI